MPIYEYECEGCGKISEVIQKFSDKPVTECGHCTGHLHKLISQSSFHLKGTGWYVTDYANKRGNKTTAPKKKKETKKNSTPKSKKVSTKSD